MRSKILAFSLVEVVTALGITSFAIIAILGIIPTGLTTLSDAGDNTVQSQILRGIGSQAVVTSWGNLTSTNFYDSEGQPISDTSATSTFPHYRVVTDLMSPTYPGSNNHTGTGNSTLTNSLAGLSVNMTYFKGSNIAVRTNTFTLQIANPGK